MAIIKFPTPCEIELSETDKLLIELVNDVLNVGERLTKVEIAWENDTPAIEYEVEK